MIEIQTGSVNIKYTLLYMQKFNTHIEDVTARLQHKFKSLD